ncbi:MAG: hypothetical protein LN412_05735 [Candidatus Thermoplasmatota archaeon]|nr:hypothetical protein [Candidatus Thermoplasmatota archaeon]
MRENLRIVRKGCPAAQRASHWPWTSTFVSSTAMALLRLSLLETLYLAQRGALSAGALEGFLTTFMPLALDPQQKLVLADELESLTEPETAGALIATFLEMARASGSYGVLVTHTARSVLQRVDVRVDGIEARSLDEAYNLVVDQTPQRNRIARSTPELILQRLMALRPRAQMAK